MRRRLAVAALALSAGGCATLPAPAPGDDWPARRAELQALDRWSLDGRIAVAAGENGFSGGFDWVQQGERADVTLSKPMGGPGLEIHVDGDTLSVTLRGETYSGDDARRLIEEQIGPGHALPVNEMRYWLVGAPAPGLPHEAALDASRQLASVAQSGWQVRYERFGSIGGLQLPQRLEMTTDGLRIRVVVSSWKVADELPRP